MILNGVMARILRYFTVLCTISSQNNIIRPTSV